jgi:hypothetical protein
MALTFENDIAPIFSQWVDRMMWRLDLSKYEDVKANAEIIYDQISQGGMPPPPYPGLAPADIATFKTWMEAGCPQ